VLAMNPVDATQEEAMYRLTPPAVYVSDRAMADARSAARVGRMLAALGCEERAIPFTDTDIPEMIRAQGWETARRRQGTHAGHRDPALVFTTIRFDDRPDPKRLLEECPPGTPPSLVHQLLGYGGRTVHRENPKHDRVCRCRYQFETIFGCPHGCCYCTGGQVSIIYVNLEELIERQIAPTLAGNPRQNVFMFNSALSDTLSFEPEYGLTQLMAELCAATEDRYYLIHTKSANVDFLRNIDHRGHTILLWSLTSPTVSRVVEPGSGTTEERIEAMGKCADAGYPVRVKFKPIVPVRGWREEAEAMVDALLARVRPDNIGLCTIAWMPLAELRDCIDFSLMDPEFVCAMEDAEARMRGVHTGPIPPEMRARVYQFYLDAIRARDREVPVFLCTESPELWQEFAPRLGMSPGDYVCACGPQTTPGARRIAELWEPESVA